MPNWCFTEYVVKGDEKDIKSLKEIFDSTLEAEQVAPNDFGPRWLGNLVHKFGKNWETTPCRGTFGNEEIHDGNMLAFNTTTAWGRCESVEEMIRERFPDVTVWFLEEELGCDIFVTNDADEIIFPEQYIIDIANKGMEYFTKEKALNKISEIAGRTITTFNEAVKWTEEHNNNVKNENYIIIKKATIE